MPVFLRKKIEQKRRLIDPGRAGTTIAKTELETRRVKRVNRVRLKDCGEWKLWGRHPLTIEKQAVALSGERS
jgi:hypothetical protein